MTVFPKIYDKSAKCETLGLLGETFFAFSPPLTYSHIIF